MKKIKIYIFVSSNVFKGVDFGKNSEKYPNIKAKNHGGIKIVMFFLNGWSVNVTSWGDPCTRAYA